MDLLAKDPQARLRNDWTIADNLNEITSNDQLSNTSQSRLGNQ